MQVYNVSVVLVLFKGTEEEGVQKKAMEEAADIISQMAFKARVIIM